jgi:hypothetical protein
MGKHVARTDTRINAYNLVGKHAGNRTSGKPRSTQDEHIKVDLNRVSSLAVGSTSSGHGSLAGFCERGE